MSLDKRRMMDKIASDASHNLIQSVIGFMKDSIAKSPLVQEEIRQELKNIIPRLRTVAPSFRDAFLAIFEFQKTLRAIKEPKFLKLKIMEIINGPMHQQNSLFAASRTNMELVYQCGSPSVRAVLDLDAWIKPNDADVRLCVMFCQGIRLLENFGYFRVKKPTEKKKPTKPDKEEISVLRWKFDRPEKNKDF